MFHSFPSFHLWNSVQHDVGQFSGHSQVSEHLETLKQHGCLFFCFSHCHGIQLTTFRLQFIIFITLISPFAIVTKKWACHFVVCSTCSEWFWNTSTCALAAAASAAGSVDFSKTPHTVHDAFNALHSLQTTATTNNSSNNDKNNMIIIIVTTGTYNYMPTFYLQQKALLCSFQNCSSSFWQQCSQKETTIQRKSTDTELGHKELFFFDECPSSLAKTRRAEPTPSLPVAIG